MAYYQGDISSLLNTINTNIITIGNDLYKSVLLGSTNANHKRNLRLLGIGKSLLSNQVTLTAKPAFLYKLTVLDPTLESDITISYDGVSSLQSDCIANDGELSLTKSQFLETIERFYNNPATDLSPLTTRDIHTFIIDDSIYIYSSSNIFTSNAEVTVTTEDAISVTSYLDDSASIIDSLNNKGSVDTLIPNIIDITNEYKDREDFSKDNPNPYSIKNIQLLAESTSANTSTGTNTVSGHNQNTDSYLAKNTSNQVSASDLRIHLDNTDIHLTESQIQTLIEGLIAAIAIEDLTNVTVSGLANDYILQYKTSTSKWTAVELPSAIDSISDLDDVDDSSRDNDYILRFNSSSGNWEAEAFPSFAQDLSGLDDVNTVGVINEQILQYNAVAGEWQNVTLNTASTLDELTDTDLTGIADDSFLKYDNSATKWKVFSVENPTLVTPTIYGDISGSNIWTVYQDDGTTPLSLLSGSLTNQSITVDSGAKVEVSAYFKYPVVSSGYKGPDSISGDFGNTDPGENTNSASKTHTDLEGGVITRTTEGSKSYSVTLAGAKQGLVVSGSNVVVATGNDTKSDTISVSFKNRIYFGYNTATSLGEAEIKALSTVRFGDESETFSGVTASGGKYTYFCYDDSNADLSSVILDGSSPILGAFTKLSDVVITNPAGISKTLTVYRSNATDAFVGNSLAFS